MIQDPGSDDGLHYYGSDYGSTAVHDRKLRLLRWDTPGPTDTEVCVGGEGRTLVVKNVSSRP